MTKRFEAVVQRALDETEKQKHTDGRTIYKAVATTPALDRYGEVVLPKGAITDHFMKNPVLLDGHNYQAAPVGHIVALDMVEDSVVMSFVFSRDARGQELEQKTIDGDMGAFSIGFRPKAVVNLWYPWEDPPEVKEIAVEYPDGSEGKINLRDYEHVPYRIYNKWELLEVSAVSVPANPEALLLRQAEDIVRRASAQDPVMKSFVQDRVRSQFAPLMELLAQFEDLDDTTIKIEGAVPSHSTPIEEGKWSGSAARSALAKWASKGGTGKKEDMNWSKYSKGFGWFDSKAADSFGAYKLPHHTVKNGALIAVWNGVTAAMAALLGARGGVDLDSKSAVYRHLAKHYKDFDKEPPEMKEYSEEELKAIETESLVVEPDAAASAEGAQPAEKADDPDGDDDAADDDGDGEDEEKVPNNVLGLLQITVDLVKQVLQAVQALSDKNEEDSEATTESLVELQLAVERVEDAVHYAGFKKPPEGGEKSGGTKEVIDEVSEDLVADLERVNSL